MKNKLLWYNNFMSIVEIKNLFSEEEIQDLHHTIDSVTIPKDENGNYIICKNTDGVDKNLGRLVSILELDSDCSPHIPPYIQDKLVRIAEDVLNEPLGISHALHATYSGKYGTPNLPPHFDGDTNDLIINFQLSSNTSWDLGLGLQTYGVEDNSALIFNGNEHIHWRPNKVFNEEEYVQMIFFRFFKINSRSDYSHLRLSQTDKVFEDVVKFRNSL
jgi:hypothetical protein